MEVNEKEAKRRGMDSYGYAQPVSWNCPKCGKPTRITDTRQKQTERMRVRTCPKRHKFVTIETFDYWVGEGRRRAEE